MREEALSDTFSRTVKCPHCKKDNHYLFKTLMTPIGAEISVKCEYCKKEFMDIPNEVIL